MSLFNNLQSTMQLLSRKVMLNWQAKVVEKAIRELPESKRREAAELALAGLDSQHACSNGEVAQRAFERVRSKLQPVRVRGLATWVAAVYHETRNSGDEGLAAVHREVLGLIAQLKEALPTRAVA